MEKSLSYREWCDLGAASLPGGCVVSGVVVWCILYVRHTCVCACTCVCVHQRTCVHELGAIEVIGHPCHPPTAIGWRLFALGAVWPLDTDMKAPLCYRATSGFGVALLTGSVVISLPLGVPLTAHFPFLLICACNSWGDLKLVICQAGTAVIGNAFPNS